MANFLTSPNMLLTIPIPGVDPGPDWANNLNASLGIIDAHNHAPGSGVQINPAGININSDLTFNNSNNAIALRSARFNPQASPISASGSDLGCLYEAGVDLYYNDGSGNQIRITQSGSVAGASGTITGLPSGTASAAFASGSGTFVFQQATSTGANLDVASIAIRYPGSYPTPSGNYIQLQAPTSLASGYSLTLPALPVANNTFLTVSTLGIISSTFTVDNSTIEISGSSIGVKSGGVGTSQIANGSITKPKLGSFGQQISNSCGNFSVSTGSFVAVTNLAITITTTGRLVTITCIPDGSSNPSSIGSNTTAIWQIRRNGTPIAYGSVNGSSGNASPVSSVLFFDTNASAGANTYDVMVNGNLFFSYAKLIVYEN